MEKTNDFKEVIFDEEIYNSEIDTQTKNAERAEQAIQTLKDENLSITVSFIGKVAKDEDYYKSYIDSLYNDSVKRLGFTPRETKERLRREFNDLFERTNSSAIRLGSLFNNGMVFIDKDKSVAINHDSIESIAKDKATTYVNTTKVAEYYNEIMKVKDAMDNLTVYQTKSGLPDIMSTEHSGGLYYSKGKYSHTLTFEGLKQQNFDKELFSHATAPYFKKG